MSAPISGSGTVRTVRDDLKSETKKYVRTLLRGDLRSAGNRRQEIVLQLWSALNPDPHAPPMRPIADIRRYTLALVSRSKAGKFIPPPRIAQVRRDKARAERCKENRARSAEERRVAEVTAALARGEHPGFGPSAPRRCHG